MSGSEVADTPALRKARGAFFTPNEITRFISRWAIHGPEDRVLEPSAGDAAFLVAAVDRLHELAQDPAWTPAVDGVELHPHSARTARQRVLTAGGLPQVEEGDFFLVPPRPKYDAVIGNPPYIRYQDFTGRSRARSREAALRAGVSLTGLASSWAAFTVHSALFLKDGGRMGLVLPAELLSVNYAAPVRRFLFNRFGSVELVLFDEQVFPGAEADVVLLLASGYGHGPTDHAIIHQARNAAGLSSLGEGSPWTPTEPAAKWTGSLVLPTAMEPLSALLSGGPFTTLESWGDTTLGIVTGNNKYFTLSPSRARELDLPRSELLRLSPPGSSHLRGLTLSRSMLSRLGADGKATYLFSPRSTPSPQARAYIEVGRKAGVDEAYKCRVRKEWYRVPLLAPADLLLTCMNADTPRLTTNEAKAHHLNSVHGVYLAPNLRDMGRDLLPLASLNSVTMLNAEMVGRSYGGGVLKIEPREADVWAMPSPTFVETRAQELLCVRDRVARCLRAGDLAAAVAWVDQVLLVDSGAVSSEQVSTVREARSTLANRRRARGSSGR